MTLVRTCLLVLLAGIMAACSPRSGALPRLYMLAQRDAAGDAYFVADTRFLGADANFAVLQIWRARVGESKPLLRVTLDDWCGNPIAWQLAPDGIVVPATPATLRQDPENPQKCAAQPTRAYVLRDGQFVMEER